MNTPGKVFLATPLKLYGSSSLEDFFSNLNTRQTGLSTPFSVELSVKIIKLHLLKVFTSSACHVLVRFLISPKFLKNGKLESLI